MEPLVLMGRSTALELTQQHSGFGLHHTPTFTSPLFCFQRILLSGKAMDRNKIFYSYSPASFPSGCAPRHPWMGVRGWGA